MSIISKHTHEFHLNLFLELVWKHDGYALDVRKTSKRLFKDLGTEV